MAEKKKELSFADIESDNEIWEIFTEDVNIEKPTEEDSDDESNEEVKKKKVEEEDKDGEIDDETSEETQEEDESEESDDENPEIYFAKHYSEEGILSIPESLSPEDPDYFKKSLEHTIEEGIENYKNSLPESAKDFIEFIKNGGKEEDYFEIASSGDYSELDLEDETNQKLVYKAYLEQTTSFNAEKIKKLVERAEEELELEDNSKEAKEFFINNKAEAKKALVEAQKLEAKNHKENQEKFLTSAKSIIDSEKEIFDIPLGSKKEREEIYNYIFQPTEKYTTPDGRNILITKMQADKLKYTAKPEDRIKTLIFEAVNLKKGFDMSAVKTKGVTEHSKRLKELADKAKTKSTAGGLIKTGGKSIAEREDKSTNLWEAALKDF